MRLSSPFSSPSRGQADSHGRNHVSDRWTDVSGSPGSGTPRWLTPRTPAREDRSGRRQLDREHGAEAGRRHLHRGTDGGRRPSGESQPEPGPVVLVPGAEARAEHVLDDDPPGAGTRDHLDLRVGVPVRVVDHRGDHPLQESGSDQCLEPGDRGHIGADRRRGAGRDESRDDLADVRLVGALVGVPRDVEQRRDRLIEPIDLLADTLATVAEGVVGIGQERQLRLTVRGGQRGPTGDGGSMRNSVGVSLS